MDQEQERLWKAFLVGFQESGEGWNGVMMRYHEDRYLRRLRAKFDALHESGKFDEPYEWSVHDGDNQK